MWVCRDPDLIEHYLRHIDDDSAWMFIFYIGKRSLNLNDGDIGWLKGRRTLKIIQGLVCCIVDNISNDLGLPTAPTLAGKIRTIHAIDLRQLAHDSICVKDGILAGRLQREGDSRHGR